MPLTDQNVPAKAAEHNRPPLSGQKTMHVSTCFLQRHDRYQDEHQDEEYPQVLQASQTQLLPQEMRLSGHHPKLMDEMDPKPKGCRHNQKFHLYDNLNKEAIREICHYKAGHALALVRKHRLITCSITSFTDSLTTFINLSSSTPQSRISWTGTSPTSVSTRGSFNSFPTLPLHKIRKEKQCYSALTMSDTTTQNRVSNGLHSTDVLHYYYYFSFF